MKRYRKGNSGRPAPDAPDDWPTPPEPQPRIEPGADIGHIEIVAHGQAVRIPLKQPGMVNGRDARSDWVALPDESRGLWVVMSVREAALLASSRIARPMSKKVQAAWDR